MTNIGDSISAIYNRNDNVKRFEFKTGIYNLENILTQYEKDVELPHKSPLEDIIKYVIKFIQRRMIIFIVTDINGMSSISDDTLRKLSHLHDVLFINISDALMTGYNAYDIDDEDYIPDYILKDEKLKDIEIQIKTKIYEETKNRFKKYKITTTTINNQKEIVGEIFKLLERHKNVSIH